MGKLNLAAPALAVNLALSGYLGELTVGDLSVGWHTSVSAFLRGAAHVFAAAGSKQSLLKEKRLISRLLNGSADRRDFLRTRLYF